MDTVTEKAVRSKNRMVSFLSEENKSGSSMHYAYLEAYRKRKKERLASEIDISEDESFSNSNMSGNSVFLASYRRRKKKLLATELNIVEISPEVSKEKKDGSSPSVPQNHGSFGTAANSNKEASEPLQLTPQNRESSVPAFYEGETVRNKEPKSLSNGIDNERSIADKKPTVPKKQFNRFSEEISDDHRDIFFEKPTSDSPLLTSGLDAHSNLSFSDKESDSFQSSSGLDADSGRSTGGFASNAVKSNTKSHSGTADNKNQQKKSSKGKAKAAILLTLVTAIVCGFMLISTMRNDSLISDDKNSSSYDQDNAKQYITKATEQTEDTAKDHSTTAATSESTTESSEEETRTTFTTKHYEALSPGQQNDDVMIMQKRLAQLGYIKIDSCTGYYGEITEKMVKMFQQKAGLKQTGIADSETLARLYADDAPDCLHG